MGDSISILRSRATIREWDFESSVPVAGLLISVGQRFAHTITGRWPLRYAIQQQTEFNHALLEVLQPLLQNFPQDLELRLQYLERAVIEQDRAIVELRRNLARLEMAVRASAPATGQEPGDHSMAGCFSVSGLTAAAEHESDEVPFQCRAQEDAENGVG